MADLPWFKFYVRDWMDSDSVGAMSDAAVVCYMQLLCRQWVNGSVPADPKKLAAILRRPVDSFVADLWPELSPCFTAHPTEPGKLVNPRLDAERSNVDEAGERRTAMASVAGTASARSRSGKSGAKDRLNATSTDRSTPVQRSVDGPFNAPLTERSTPGQQEWRMENGDLEGARLSLPGDRAGADAPRPAPADPSRGRERDSTPCIEDTLPDGNATPWTSKAETRPPPNPALAAVDAVRAAWTDAYRAATGQLPNWGVRTNAAASRLAGLEVQLSELRARMGRFFGGAPAGFWRSIRQGEFPDLLGFEMVVGRLVDAPLPAVAAPPTASAGPPAQSGRPIHPRLEGAAAVMADAQRKIAAIHARRAAAADPVTVEARVVEPKAGAPPPVLALADAGGGP